MSPPGTRPAPEEADLVALAGRLQGVAIERRVTVATAESCTGGLVGHLITEVPGSSAYFRGGVVCYADAVKVAALGLDERLIEAHGAVSGPVAAAMAEGARSRLGADYAAAVTGIAGPVDDGTRKPVGLTFVATAGPDGTVVERHVWSGDRSANKRASAGAVLELLLARLAVGPRPGPVR